MPWYAAIEPYLWCSLTGRSTEYPEGFADDLERSRSLPGAVKLDGGLLDVLALCGATSFIDECSLVELE
jgi:hypothetical protein